MCGPLFVVLSLFACFLAALPSVLFEAEKEKANEEGEKERDRAAETKEKKKILPRERKEKAEGEREKDGERSSGRSVRHFANTHQTSDEGQDGKNRRNIAIFSP